MALSLPPARSAGRRPLDAALNLVPFIDLLSCCIAFLLLTAVWSRAAGIDVQTAGAGGEPVVAAPPTLWIGAGGYELRVPGETAIAVASTALAATLRAHRSGDELIVLSDDDVDYARLIGGLDAARAAGFARLQIP